ncbi:MAG: glycerophosphoryl diester phosphodiesterase membrane domain-containing protein [bacterium]
MDTSPTPTPVVPPVQPTTSPIVPTSIKPHVEIFSLYGSMWEYFQKHWKRLVLIQAILFIPYEVVSFLPRIGGSQTLDASAAMSVGQIFTFLALTALVIIVDLFLTAWGQGALFLALRDASSSATQLLSLSSRIILPVTGVLLLAALATTAGAFLFLLPGIYVAIMFSVAAPVVVYEKTGGTQALRRSWGYIKGNWWRVFGSFLLGGVVILVVLLILGALFDRLFQREAGSVITAAFSYVLITPLSICFLSALYERLSQKAPPV